MELCTVTDTVDCLQANYAAPAPIGSAHVHVYIYVHMCSTLCTFRCTFRCRLPQNQAGKNPVTKPDAITVSMNLLLVPKNSLICVRGHFRHLILKKVHI